jgi:hypothetical protein
MINAYKAWFENLKVKVRVQYEDNMKPILGNIVQSSDWIYLVQPSRMGVFCGYSMIIQFKRREFLIRMNIYTLYKIGRSCIINLSEGIALFEILIGQNTACASAGPSRSE